jgi:hypothetical protein
MNEPPKMINAARKYNAREAKERWRRASTILQTEAMVQQAQVQQAYVQRRRPRQTRGSIHHSRHARPIQRSLPPQGRRMSRHPAAQPRHHSPRGGTPDQMTAIWQQRAANKPRSPQTSPQATFNHRKSVAPTFNHRKSVAPGNLYRRQNNLSGVVPVGKYTLIVVLLHSRALRRTVVRHHTIQTVLSTHILHILPQHISPRE